MKSLYQKIIAHEGDFRDFFVRMDLMEIFSPIIDRFDPPTARCIIRYIAYAYSKESDYINLRETVKRIKDRCIEQSDLPQTLIAQVAYFIPTDEEDDLPAMIRGVATKYLAYQDEPSAEDLISLRDLYDEMRRATNMPVTKDEHYKLKYECRKYANDIKEWIKEAETRIREEDTKLKAIKQDLREKTKFSTQALRPENTAGMYNSTPPEIPSDDRQN